MALMKAAVIVTLMAFAIDAARLEASDGLEISMLQEELSRRSSLILELRHKEIQHLGEALKANASKMEKWGGGFGNGFDFSGWMAPSAPCASSQNTWQVAMCLYQMSGGNLQNIFYQLAGMDGKIDVSEWAARVAPTNAAKRIFITVASQEAPGRSFGGGDDPNTIDFDDWMRFVQAAQQAAGASMDVNEWSDYVAASVTAEALFDAANGHAGQVGFFLGDRLNTMEWSMAFYKVGGMDGGVTLLELSRVVGLYPADVHKVFKFIEDVGDGVCDRAWGSWESDAQDEMKIDSCEWNQLLPALQKFTSDLSWQGISKGSFSNAIAQMITAYYQSHPYTRYSR